MIGKPRESLKKMLYELLDELDELSNPGFDRGVLT